MKERGRGLGGEKMLFGDRCFSPLSAYLVLLLQLVAPTFLETLKYGKLLNVWEIQNIYIYIMLLVWKEMIQVGEIEKIHQTLIVVE